MKRIIIILIFIVILLSSTSICLYYLSIEKIKQYPEKIEPIHESVKVIKKPVFNIKVKYWGSCYWSVSFTNDDFKTEYDLMETFDISGGYIGDCVVRQLKLFGSMPDAVKFAREFTTIEQCLQYNEKVEKKYIQLKEYRKLHPTQKIPFEAPACGLDQKEVIIY